MISQLGQDKEVLQTYNFKKHGFFVEIGANDGVRLSNTLLLERDYGWKGICVEPDPIVFEKLVKNRKSLCVQKAMFNVSDTTVSFSVNPNSLLSGISTHIIDAFNDVASNVIEVSTINMNDLLDKNNAPKFIEYLSLDTEGTEFEILESTDFTKYTFGVIHVEHNYQVERRQKIRSLLEKNGYVFFKEVRWDDSYIHSSLQVSKIPRFTKKLLWNRF
jgi:FkbM family methyltransferase